MKTIQLEPITEQEAQQLVDLLNLAILHPDKGGARIATFALPLINKIISAANKPEPAPPKEPEKVQIT